MNAGSATATSANPPSIVNAMTRSPALKPEPSGADRTLPATSTPGTNGSGGFIWYSPRVSSRSGKLTPAAATSMTTRVTVLGLLDVDQPQSRRPLEPVNLLCAHLDSSIPSMAADDATVGS